MFKKFRFRKTKCAKLFGYFLLNTILAPWTLANITSRIYEKFATRNSPKFWLLTFVFSSLFVLTISFYLIQFLFPWAWAIGFIGHLAFGGCIAVVRMHTREKLNIQGHIIEDFLVSIMLYPSVVLQMKMSLDNHSIKSKYLP